MQAWTAFAGRHRTKDIAQSGEVAISTTEMGQRVLSALG